MTCIESHLYMSLCVTRNIQVVPHMHPRKLRAAPSDTSQEILELGDQHDDGKLRAAPSEAVRKDF